MSSEWVSKNDKSLGPTGEDKFTMKDSAVHFLWWIHLFSAIIILNIFANQTNFFHLYHARR